MFLIPVQGIDLFHFPIRQFEIIQFRILLYMGWITGTRNDYNTFLQIPAENSRQMKELEAELGKKLFTRSSYSIHLTEEGMLLRKRAEDLLAMTDKITNEFQTMDDIAGGDVYIGCAESYLIKYLAQAVKNLNLRYDGIHYHITSGDTEQVTERLDRGLFDMAFIVEPPDLSKYNYLRSMTGIR